MGKQSRAKVHEDLVPELKTEIAKLQSKLNSAVNDIEKLAQELHESGREAVLNNKVLKKDGAEIGKIIFTEWNNLPEEAKEGRRIQIRWLLNKYNLIPK